MQAGTYFETTREWKNGDSVEFAFDLTVRAIVGERQARGKVSLFRGPLFSRGISATTRSTNRTSRGLISNDSRR